MGKPKLVRCSESTTTNKECTRCLHSEPHEITDLCKSKCEWTGKNTTCVPISKEPFELDETQEITKIPKWHNHTVFGGVTESNFDAAILELNDLANKHKSFKVLSHHIITNGGRANHCFLYQYTK